MIRKIILENYMAHVRTVIEPAAGLTVLIGPNNCGKSAIAHALEMICYNSDAAGFAVRHGTKKATVTIETQDEDGTVHTLVWWRNKVTAGYIIDGREIPNMGRGKFPDDLHNHLRMPEIPSSTGKAFHIHFGLQKEPIFLLDDPPSRAAQFFASSSDADRLMEMQRRHKQKETNSRRDKDRLDQEILRLDQQLNDLTELPKLSEQLNRLETTYAEINFAELQLQLMSKAIGSLQHATFLESACLSRANALLHLQVPPQYHLIAPLSKLIEAIGTTENQASINQAKREVLVELKSEPSLAVTSGLKRLIDDLSNSQHRFERESARTTAVKPLTSAPSQGDVRAMSQLLLRLETLTSDMQRHETRSSVLVSLADPPVTVDLNPLRRHISLLSAAAQKRARFQARYQFLDQLPDVPVESDPRPLMEIVTQMDKSITALNAAQKTMDTSQHKLDELQTRIEAFVRDNPRCQSCGQSITAELVLTDGHHHE